MENMTFGDRLADTIATFMGSWRFIVIQSVLVLIWMALNLLAWIDHFDPYPFVLLNLVFSTQAAYAAPIIMQAQNRQAKKDRLNAEADLQIDTKAEMEIGQLFDEMRRIEQEKIDKLMELLNR